MGFLGFRVLGFRVFGVYGLKGLLVFDFGCPYVLLLHVVCLSGYVLEAGMI